MSGANPTPAAVTDRALAEAVVAYDLALPAFTTRPPLPEHTEAMRAAIRAALECEATR